MQGVNEACDVKQAGDSTWCETCGNRWDTNEPTPPPCPVPPVDYDAPGRSIHDTMTNRALHALDISLKAATPHGHIQLGIAIMLCVLAAGRVLDAHAPERGKRMKLIKTMIGEFDSKLRTYVRMTKGQSESTG